MQTFQDLLNYGKTILSDFQNPNTKQDLFWILEDVFSRPKSTLLTQLHTPQPQPLLATAKSHIDRLAAQEPLAYILGHTQFLEHHYLCTAPVLIPRPETECVVTYGIQHLKTHFQNNPFVIFELGTGTGCMSIELALAFPKAIVHTWDISEAAYHLAQNNAQHLGATNVVCHHGDFFLAYPMQQDILHQTGLPFCVVSNPPYISKAAYETLDFSVKQYEDPTALIGGTSGEEFYEKVIETWGTQPQLYLFEIGFDQGHLLEPESCIKIQSMIKKIYKDDARHFRVLLLQNNIPKV